MADIDTAALRDTADLDSRAGAPVGNALRLAADEIDRLRRRLVEVEKLCEDGTIRDNWTAIQVLAAARGEGDRG